MARDDRVTATTEPKEIPEWIQELVRPPSSAGNPNFKGALTWEQAIAATPNAWIQTGGDPKFNEAAVEDTFMKAAYHAKEYRDNPEYAKAWDKSHGSRNESFKKGALSLAAMAAFAYGGQALAGAASGGTTAGIMGGAAAPGGVYSAGAGAIVPNSAAAASAFGAAAGGATAIPLAASAPITSTALGSASGVAPSGLSALGPTGSGFAGTGPGVATTVGSTGGASAAQIASSVAGAGGTPIIPAGSSNLGSLAAGAPALSGGQTPSGPGTNNLGSGLTGSGLTDNLAILGSSLASGLFSYNATEKGIEENRRQYDQTREDFEPWRQAGIQGLGQYQDRLNQPVPEFQFKLEDDPIYQFQLAESQKATERGMAARGYNNSGNVLQELSRDAIGQAGKYQDQAYNRQLGTSQTNYGRNLDRTNQYGNLAGVGQTATQSVASAGQNSTNNLQNLYLQQGQGLNNSIQGGLNNYLLNNYLRR